MANKRTGLFSSSSQRIRRPFRGSAPVWRAGAFNRTLVNYLRRERGSISPLIDSTLARAHVRTYKYMRRYIATRVCVYVCRRPQNTLPKNADHDAVCALANQMNHIKEALARARCVRSVFEAAAVDL